MADPFEVRLRFTSLLTHLTASTTSSHKTASFALKHRDMDEDLHSCILESLEAPSTSMNARANICYFLEQFCEMAGREGGEGHGAYVEMVRRDMGRIAVSVVTGGGGRSAGGGSGGQGSGGQGANIKVVRRVVESLRGRGVLDGEGVRTIEEDLRRREMERAGDVAGGEGGHTDEQERKEASRQDDKRRQEHREQRDKHNAAKAKEGRSNGHRVDKRAIEQRIEEDRERNKRLRESVWAVNGNDDDELDKLWEETSDLNEEDFVLAREEADERAQFARYHRTLLQEAGR